MAEKTKVTVKLYTGREVTWDLARRAAYVQNDAFFDNLLHVEYWSKEYDFSKVQPLPGYHRLVQTPRPFQVAVNHTARTLFYKARTDPRFCLIMGRDEATDEDIAMATIILPFYAPPVARQPPTPRRFGALRTLAESVGSKMYALALGVLFKAWDMWETRSFTDQFAPPAMLACLSFGDRNCGAVATPERVAELRGMSEAELKHTAYPKTWSYYINYFGTSASHQGRGVGGQFMKLVLDALRSATTCVGPPGVAGPPKMELFSSPPGAPFYERCGFRLGGSADERQPSGEMLTHKFYYLNL